MKMWTVVEFLSWFNSEKSNPIRQVVLKSSSLVQQSSQLPGENHTVEFLQGIFNKRQKRSCTGISGQGGFMSSHCGL